MLTEEIHHITKKAKLKITSTENFIEIRHFNRIGDQSFWVKLFLILGGLFFIIESIGKEYSISIKIAGAAFGLFLILLPLITFIRERSDGLKLENTKIDFRYNLKKGTITLNHNEKIILKTEFSRISSQNGPGTDFIDITLLLSDHHSEIPILKYHMIRDNTSEALKLGDVLEQTINAFIRDQKNI